MKHHSKLILGFGIFLILLSTQRSSFASYEVATPANAKYSGMGFATTATVNDSASVYTNPAGLGFMPGILSAEAGLNAFFLSAPSGPLLTGSSPSGVSQFLFPTNLGIGFRPLDDLAVGLTFAPVGQLKFEYLTPAPALFSNNFLNDLRIFELAAGIGYKISDVLSVGASYRVSFAGFKHSSTLLAQSSTAFYYDFSDTNFAGFRLGVQYQPLEVLKLGIHYRSQVQLSLSGVSTANYGGSAQAIFPTKQTWITYFPQSLGVGVATNAIVPELLLTAEGDWFNYDRNSTFSLIDEVTGPSLVTFDMVWQNNVSLRLGAQYDFPGIAVRAGYVYTSATSTTRNPQALFGIPAPTNTFTLGLTKDFTMLSLDLAFVHSTSSQQVTDSTFGLNGNYSSTLNGVFLQARTNL